MLSEAMARRNARLSVELRRLQDDPVPGTSAWLLGDDMSVPFIKMEAQLEGPAKSPYEGGSFMLSIQIPENYPVSPPSVCFKTQVYHPNIDEDGRICLDSLKENHWSVALDISKLLLSIIVLMGEPNGDDGLVPHITKLFQTNKAKFQEEATKHTKQHAFKNSAVYCTKSASSSSAAAVTEHISVGTITNSRDVQGFRNVLKRQYGESEEEVSSSDLDDSNSDYSGESDDSSVGLQRPDATDSQMSRIMSSRLQDNMPVKRSKNKDNVYP